MILFIFTFTCSGVWNRSTSYNVSTAVQQRSPVVCGGYRNQKPLKKKTSQPCPALGVRWCLNVKQYSSARFLTLISFRSNRLLLMWTILSIIITNENVIFHVRVAIYERRVSIVYLLHSCVRLRYTLRSIAFRPLWDGYTFMLVRSRLSVGCLSKLSRHYCLTFVRDN